MAPFKGLSLFAMGLVRVKLPFLNFHVSDVWYDQTSSEASLGLTLFVFHPMIASQRNATGLVGDEIV